MEKIGAVLPMSAFQSDMFHKLFPGVEMVIGDFIILKRRATPEQAREGFQKMREG